jgi:hypothetical protein
MRTFIKAALEFQWKRKKEKLEQKYYNISSKKDARKFDREEGLGKSNNKDGSSSNNKDAYKFDSDM